ncbi:hypothetical protein GCM10017786_64110 [Amycolatopsis deserti]|uniref:Uncharacterized protein n=1 Tax=Amycolatopsis deserti TaxID=185696 RepID=A0ABQ3JFJ1_9PSEU|nr:hypothetical protein [Amycolatopsis deserti]GHF21329.1 hypothetical protein GCM10017786_64110 [Amycolatopsis deserti]
MLVLGPIWIATGLPAPIALGLPVGLVVRVVLGGSPSPDVSALFASVSPAARVG